MNLCSELLSQHHLRSHPLVTLRLGGGRSPGLGTPHFRGLALLHGLLALADGGGAGDGVLAQVGAVVAVGGRLDNGRVRLAGAPAGREGGLLDVRCGLVALAGLLGQEDDAALGTGLDADGLWSVVNISIIPVGWSAFSSWEARVGAWVAYFVVDETLILRSG